MDGKEFTCSEVIDRAGLSAHTWIVFVFLALAMIFDGYDFMIVNSTNTYVAPTFFADQIAAGQPIAALTGSLTTWGLLGMVLGGAVGGVLSDAIGRKKTLTIAVIFYGLFTLPQAFAPDYAFFCAFRLIAGFGVGSCIPVVTTVFSESMPSKQRGIFVTAGMAGMVCGWVIAGLVAAPVCSNPNPIFPFCEGQITLANGTQAVQNWRLCYLIGAIPVVYGIFLFFFMHETPHWYANHGQKEKACARLSQIVSATRHKDVEFDPNLLIVPPKPAKSGPAALFSSKFIVATCGIWAAYFVGQFCVYGMNAWIPTWFQGNGYSAAESVTLQTWNNVAAIASNIVCGFISDAIGRKRALWIGWVLCIIAIICCSVFVPMLPGASDVIVTVGADKVNVGVLAGGAAGNFVPCIFLMLLFGFCLNYAITCVQPLMPEAYPTTLRNTGTSWCQAFARFGGSGSSIVLGAAAGLAMFQTEISGDAGTAVSNNWSMVVLVLLIPFVLGLICTLLFVKNTGGKTMDQLQAYMEEKPLSETDGNARFWVMILVVVINFIGCIVCPLAIPGFSKTDMALPIMLVAMLLPFVYFFVFGVIGIGKEKAANCYEIK